MNSKATRTRQRWGLVTAAGILLALSGLALAFQGAPVFTGLRFTPPAADLQPHPGEQQKATGTPAPQDVPHETRIDLTWVTYAVIALIVVVLLALLYRYLRRRLRSEYPGLDRDVDGSTEGSVAPEPPAQPRPERVRRGLDRALDLLGEGREPRDAIERAWLGLEEGAADSGVHRLPAETPGEFVRRVLARVASDRDAAGDLLDLYLRARFSDAPVTATDVEAARAAIEALRASWGTAAAGGALR
ncbi:DUF4129 domain-containing protein [Leifsonia sp. NPDC056665]|uniref:DUF4129 domain-containing protein n=1 Tax=Leifsonia sp. NPDC056665 TaxID=3345901 RepID=UPI0036CA3507